MHKFFVDDHQIFDNNIIINGEDASHITKVLRIKKGEEIQVSNGNKLEFIGKVVDLNKNEVHLEIIKTYNNTSETSINITIYQGLTKGSKMDLVIQKCVELGVKSFVPINTYRVVVELNNKQDKKIQRWQKIALEAAKQSKRGVIPEVKDIIPLKELDKEFCRNDINIIAYENEKEVRLKKLLTEFPDVRNIGIVIGPEGGLTEEEINYLKEAGGKTITLGDRILRTETAGMCITSMVVYHYEM